MSAARKSAGVSWRVVVAGLLLVWIFHTIFINEGRLAFQQGHTSWSALSRLQQWRAAWTYGPPELWRTLTLVHPGAFTISLACMVATIFLGVARWRMVLAVQGLSLSFSRTLGISFVAHFFNSFLLGSTGGDLMKALYAARETHHKKTEAVVTVLVDRLIGLWAMLLFAGLMMLPNLSLILRYKRLAAVSLFILLMLAGCTVILGVAFWGGISRFWPGARAFFRKLPKGEMLERSLDACRQFGGHRWFLARTLLISMVINLANVGQLIALSEGLGLGIPWMALAVIVPIIICISALPITPSGLGVRENLFVLMLAVPEINVPATGALSLSLLAFAGFLFWSLVGGVVYVTLKDREHLEQVEREE